MKKIVASLSVFAFLLSGSFVFGADKVVVIPLGKNVKSTNKTFYYNLPPAAFTPVLFSTDAPRGNFLSGEWFSLSPPLLLSGLAAPVQLPDGSEVTDYTCYVYDADTTENISGNSPAYIWRRPILSPDKEPISTEFNMGTTGDSTSIQSFSSPSITSPTIDNSQYVYGAYVLYKITDSPSSYINLRFYGCRITYTLDVIQP